MPRRFRVVTAVWGVSLVGEALLRMALAITIPTQAFLVISQVVNWTVLGGVTEIAPGQYQFTDSQAASDSKRFYRVRSP